MPSLAGSRVAMSITVASAEGPAMSGMASGTMNGSPFGWGPNAPSGFPNTIRIAIMKRMIPPAIDSDASERCISSRILRPKSMKSARVAKAMRHSRTITLRRRGAGTSASMAFTIGTLPKASVTSTSTTKAERISKVTMASPL